MVSDWLISLATTTKQKNIHHILGGGNWTGCNKQEEHLHNKFYRTENQLQFPANCCCCCDRNTYVNLAHIACISWQYILEVLFVLQYNSTGNKQEYLHNKFYGT